MHGVHSTLQMRALCMQQQTVGCNPRPIVLVCNRAKLHATPCSREEQPTTCLKRAHLRIISCPGAAAAAATPWDELGAGERAVRAFLALEAVSGAPAAWKFLSQVRPGYHGFLP